MTFVLNAIKVGWWHFFYLKHLITHSAYVTIITIALTFGAIGIGKWTNKQTQFI